MLADSEADVDADSDAMLVDADSEADVLADSHADVVMLIQKLMCLLIGSHLLMLC